jgi:Flp pilus assembly protein TadD
MFPTSSSAKSISQLICRGFWYALIFISLSVNVHAQLGGTGIDNDRSSGMRSGNNTIVGQVLLPQGNRENRRFTVRLSSVQVGEFSTMTDDNGVFTFRRLREGSYFVSVEAGKDYLPAQETVDLYDNRPRTTTVQIELRLRPTANTKPGVLNAALAGIPKPAVDRYEKGIAAASAGDNKTAIAELKGALSIYPQFVLALNELSAVYVNTGNLEKAEEALHTALGFEPNNPTLRLNYGYVLLLRERFADSEAELRRAIQLKDDLASAHLFRGRVLIRLQRFDEAERELNRAIGLGGSAGLTAYRYLGALYSERGETAKAIDALEKYLRLAPTAKDAEQVKKIIKQLQEEATVRK